MPSMLSDVYKTFHNLISPLSTQEYQAVEDLLSKSRCFEEAVSVICAMRLEHQDLTEEQQRYLIGKQYEMEKIIGASTVLTHNRHLHGTHSSLGRKKPCERESIRQINERFRREYHISDFTVRRYHSYACALDRLATVAPEIAVEIVLGRLKVSYESVISLSELPRNEVTKLNQGLSDFLPEFIAYSRAKVERELRKISSSASASSISVKRMPDYDPDAELTSLALTIPSWISSMERTHLNADFVGASIQAKERLATQLTQMVDTAMCILDAVEEAR